MEPAAADNTFSKLTYVQEALQDAETLLQFASETGIPVDDDTQKSVLDARAAYAKGLDEIATARLLTALAKLASVLSPVTPESVGKSKRAKDVPHHYAGRAIALAVLIVVYSTISFVTSGIANSIRIDIQTANDLAVKLNSEFPPTDGMGPSVKDPPCPLTGDGVRPPQKHRGQQIRHSPAKGKLPPRPEGTTPDSQPSKTSSYSPRPSAMSIRTLANSAVIGLLIGVATTVKASIRTTACVPIRTR